MHLYILASKQQETNLGNISNAHARSLKSKFLLSVQEDHSEQTLVWREQGYVLIVSFMGCAGENQRKGIFSFAGIPLGYAWRNNNKKKNKREKKNERKHLKQT